MLMLIDYQYMRCCLQWNNNFFAYALDEISLEDRAAKYWSNYLLFLSNTTDGEMIFSNANLNQFRKSWLNSEFSILGLRKSKRFIGYKSVLERVIEWLSSVPDDSSVPFFPIEEILTLQEFPETFV